MSRRRLIYVRVTVLVERFAVGYVDSLLTRDISQTLYPYARNYTNHIAIIIAHYPVITCALIIS